MAKFTVTNTTILHNQKTYGVGDTLDLTDEKQIAKLASYITPVADSTTDSNPTEQSTTPPTTAGADSTKATATKASKASKKSDKSANVSDSSDTSTTNDTTPPADTNAASSNADNVSAEDAASDAAKQETKNAKTVQTPAN